MNKIKLLIIFLALFFTPAFANFLLDNDTAEEICTMRNFQGEEFAICKDFFTNENFNLDSQSLSYKYKAQNVIRDVYDFSSSYWHSSKANIEMAKFVVTFTRKFGFGYNPKTKRIDSDFYNTVHKIVFCINSSTKEAFYDVLAKENIYLSDVNKAFAVDKLYNIYNLNKKEFESAFYLVKYGKIKTSDLAKLSDNEIFKLYQEIYINDDVSFAQTKVAKKYFETFMLSDIKANISIKDEKIKMLENLYYISNNANSRLLIEEIAKKDFDRLTIITNPWINKNIHPNSSKAQEMYALAYEILGNRSIFKISKTTEVEFLKNTIKEMFDLFDPPTDNQILVADKLIKTNNLKGYDTRSIIRQADKQTTNFILDVLNQKPNTD